MTNPFDDSLTREQAERKLSSRDLAMFHLHNKNGVMALWSDLGTRLLAFGRGFLAYGDTGFYYEEMNRLAKLQRVDKFALAATISGIERTIANGEAFLAQEA